MNYEYYVTSTVEKTQLNAEILKKNMEIDSLKVYHCSSTYPVSVSALVDFMVNRLHRSLISGAQILSAENSADADWFGNVMQEKVKY